MTPVEQLVAAAAATRYVCPVCGHPAASLAAKKAHVKAQHKRRKKVRRG